MPEYVCSHSGCTESIDYTPGAVLLGEPYYCDEHTSLHMGEPVPKTLKKTCSFPKCVCFETINAGDEVCDEPIHWFCDLHKGTRFMRCTNIQCLKIKIMGDDSGQAFPPQWYCDEHKQPVLHTPPKKTKYRRTCDHRACQHFIMLPAGTTRKHWFCVEHQSREAPIQAADQNKYNEQVDKAHKDLILLMAFNNCTEENVRDILIRISSNCYAMGYQEGMDRNG